MKPLDQFKTGEKGIVQGLSGGERFYSRASAMGFTPETVVDVVRGGSRGPLIVALRDTEVAIGRGEAAKIQMEEA